MFANRDKSWQTYLADWAGLARGPGAAGKPSKEETYPTALPNQRGGRRKADTINWPLHKIPRATASEGKEPISFYRPRPTLSLLSIQHLRGSALKIQRKAVANFTLA